MNIRTGALGLPGFFITDEIANYYGDSNAPPILGVHDPAGAASYPLDTTTPAVAGYFDTAQTLQLLGLIKAGDPVPAGVQVSAVVSHTPAGATLPTGTLALPVISQDSKSGASPSFIVSAFGNTNGRMQVNFGQGPGCNGLVEVATQDLYAGTDVHSVLVTGNDLPGTVGNNGIVAGVPYWFEPVITTSSGPQVDTNDGNCYYISVPRAGQLAYYNVVQCSRTPANADICNALLGPGTITSFVNSLQMSCDTSGSCPYQAYFSATGQAPGSPPLCSPDIFTTPFNGTCLETERGTVTIQPGVTGLPDFWITDEYASYFGNPPLLNVHDPAGAASYPLDTANPAVPGIYDTKRILTLMGLLPAGQNPPPGVYALLVVTQY